MQHKSLQSAQQSWLHLEMVWTSRLACLGLLVLVVMDVGGVAAGVAWVTDAPRAASLGGRRVPRQAGSGSTGTQMIELNIDSEVTYRYARTTIVSVLVNNELHASEVTFNTYIPETAFISSFYIDVDGYRLEGQVKTRDEATRIYDAARGNQVTAGLLELSARDASLFTLKVNVEASEQVAFTLTYEELLVRRLGVYSHGVHIDPGQIVDELTIRVKIDESNALTDLTIDPMRPFTATAQSGNHAAFTQDPLPTVTRPSAQSVVIEWTPTPDEQRALKQDGVQGRFFVQYDIDRLSSPNQILVHDGYFVHFYAPADLTPMDKHVVFVLDTSGSMDGTRLQQLKQAMGRVLSDLRPGDFFSIVEFSSHIKAWTGNGGGSVDLNMNSAIGGDLAVKVTPGKIQEAKDFVQALSTTGATNIHDSLIVGLKITDAGANKFASMTRRVEPMLIFLTDGNPNEGAVTDRKLIPAAITAANTKLVSIFCLGFGAGVDMEFLKELSLNNSAVARLIYEGSDAALQLEDFYREVSSPLLKNLQFQYKNVDMSTVTRAGFTTLQSGTEMIMAGKLAGSPHRMRAALNAQSRSGHYRIGFAAAQQVAVARVDFMERLWAYLNIRQLLEDPSNLANQNKAQAMALKYCFVTPLTSLVVVRPDVADPLTKIDPLRRPRNRNRAATSGEDLDDVNDPIPGPMGPGKDDTRTYNQTTSEQEPLRLSWAASAFNGTHVTVTRNQRPRVYQVKRSPTAEKYTACRGANGTWYHCRHVNACLLPAFVDDVNKYEEKYFCAIRGNFAGVCCPITS